MTSQNETTVVHNMVFQKSAAIWQEELMSLSTVTDSEIV